MYVLPFWTKGVAGIICAYHLLFNIVPTKIEAFVQSWDWFVISGLVEFCALHFQPPCNSCFRIVIICEFVSRKMILESEKEEKKITRCQICTVWQIFQVWPPETLQELSSVCLFPHYPLFQHDQIWSLNTISPHFDDSLLVLPKLWLANDESQLQKHFWHAKNELQHGLPLWATVPVKSRCLIADTLCVARCAANWHRVTS